MKLTRKIKCTSLVMDAFYSCGDVQKMSHYLRYFLELKYLSLFLLGKIILNMNQEQKQCKLYLWDSGVDNCFKNIK